MMRWMAVIYGAFAASLMRSQAQGCCTSDADCMALANTAQMDYLQRYGKAMVCDSACPAVINCNMFGVCEQCRGCFETCEGALKYVEETHGLEDTVNFCPTGEVEHISECHSVSGDGSASASSASNTGSGSVDGSSFSGGNTVVGASSATGSGEGGLSSASGSGEGGLSSATGSGEGGLSSASGSGEGSAGTGSGSASGGASSGVGSGSGGGGAGSGTGSGSGSTSSGAGSDTGGIDRSGDVPGCTCDSATVDKGQADFLCASDKSLYCDLECIEGSDPLDRLFYDMGGLWCQPFGWVGCRICRFDCDTYPDDYCVPCPEGAVDYCTY